MALKYKFIKTDSGEIVIKDAQKLARKLHKLKPGFYTVFIGVQDTRLEAMKKYYFSMESHLSRHIGHSKKELHEYIKENTDIGRTVDLDTGEIIYESVAEIADCDTMLTRIFEFQQWAAKEYNYTFEPYNEDETTHEITAAGLQTGNAAPELPEGMEGGKDNKD